jgi:hypothetical protein
MVAELSDAALQRLQEQLEVLLTESFERLPHSVAERCSGLRQQMEKRLADVVEQLQRHTPRAKQDWATFFAENVLRAQGQTPDPEAIALTLALWVVGATCFRQYYTGEAAANITNWCRSVQRRVFEAILGQGHGELYARLLRARTS